MIVPAVPVLVFKFLFWALALAVFLRTLSETWHPQPADARFQGTAMLLGVIAGAKLVYGLTYPAVPLTAFSGDSRTLLMLAGAGAAPGALLGAVLALRWARRHALRHGLPLTGPALDLDLLVVPAASALAILDCGAAFWALSEPGFGLVTEMPWGVDFGDGIRRHPVMLYEAAFLICALWAHGHLGGGLLRAGERALLFILAYCGMRVALGFFKPPFGMPFITEMMHPYPWIYLRVMTGEQWVCMLAVVGLLPAWWRLSRRLLAGLPAPAGRE